MRPSLSLCERVAILSRASSFLRPLTRYTVYFSFERFVPRSRVETKKWYKGEPDWLLMALPRSYRRVSLRMTSPPGKRPKKELKPLSSRVGLVVITYSSPVLISRSSNSLSSRLHLERLLARCHRRLYHLQAVKERLKRSRWRCSISVSRESQCEPPSPADFALILQRRMRWRSKIPRRCG